MSKLTKCIRYINYLYAIYLLTKNKNVLQSILTSEVKASSNANLKLFKLPFVLRLIGSELYVRLSKFSRPLKDMLFLIIATAKLMLWY